MKKKYYYIFRHKIIKDLTLLTNFVTDFQGEVVWNKERYWTFLVQSNSRKICNGTKRVATTLTLRLYSSMNGLIYPFSVGTVAYPFHRQCEKPDWRISVDTVLTLLFCLTANVSMEDEKYRNYKWNTNLK